MVGDTFSLGKIVMHRCGGKYITCTILLLLEIPRAAAPVYINEATSILLQYMEEK